MRKLDAGPVLGDLLVAVALAILTFLLVAVVLIYLGAPR